MEIVVKKTQSFKKKKKKKMSVSTLVSTPKACIGQNSTFNTVYYVLSLHSTNIFSESSIIQNTVATVCTLKARNSQNNSSNAVQVATVLIMFKA